ncbi:MAG: DUF2508 family protein [Acidibacillus sp.]|uniref:Uncharacterized protein n=1 Tax=Sulfoacidibacillus ferrooxidans TaxID=2005001 RepID=A0A9X1V8B0_9BACL|nr:DUF2508 family protein [Sulfoacidibacillus ferrooxidans]MCI0182645.1 hypothetical protein [Sulfoacidibacillus ferrooxidans]MCY0894083.1 DUF2508 family protein [Acidibacillus sp.]
MEDYDEFSDEQRAELLEQISKAHADWMLALQQFNNAMDVGVIDDAIYLLNAAEMRFEGLMRIARRLRIVVGVNHGLNLHSHMSDRHNSPRVNSSFTRGSSL